MNVTIENNYSSQKFSDKTLISAFLDTGGTTDNAALTVCRVDIRARIIYVTGAMFWKVSEKDNVLFATIRNDIAKLHKIYHFDIFGVETNNYGRTEIESLRREYGIQVIPVNTVGKMTDAKKLKKGYSMDKEAIIQFANSWRQNAIADKDNIRKLGQIKFIKNKTIELQKVMDELDAFVRRAPEGIGSTGRPKFGAEGTQHDDGVMSMLGNFHIIKTQIFRIFMGTGGIGHISRDSPTTKDNRPLAGGHSVMPVKN